MRGRRTNEALIAGQIALTLLLLTSAGAAINGFLRLMRTDLGYDPHHTMSVGIPVHQNTHVSWEDRSHYFAQLLARVSALPDVVAAGISTNATPPSNGNQTGFEIFGRTDRERMELRANMVSPEYFAVLRIPLLAGRLWDQAEVGRGARLAVINQTMARQYWPNGDAIGKQIRLPDAKAEPPFSQAVPDANGWMQIIGVVADARNDGLGKPVKPSLYVPYTMVMRMWTQILVRTRSNPLAALNRVRAEVKAVDADQQVFGETRDLEQWIARQDEYAYGRLIALLFGIFSLLALALAAIGLFSVVSYAVAQRTNEFGIRMALGATPRQVVELVLRATATTVVAGLAAGAVLSFAFSGVLRRWAESSAQSPFMVAGIVALLLATAAVAAFIPARRAIAVDPMDALRYE
jgi:predicted permease